MNNTALKADAIFLPGIGPKHITTEPIKRHAYYQWVPFVLFGQALFFYVPHALWKSWEGMYNINFKINLLRVIESIV